MQSNQSINDYYDLACLCDNNIAKVAMIVQIMRIKPCKNIIKQLENLRLKGLENELNVAVNLKASTIKDLSEVFDNKIFDYENKELLKFIDIKTTLLDLIERDC